MSSLDWSRVSEMLWTGFTFRCSGSRSATEPVPSILHWCALFLLPEENKIGYFYHWLPLQLWFKQKCKSKRSCEGLNKCQNCFKPFLPAEGSACCQFPESHQEEGVSTSFTLDKIAKNIYVCQISATTVLPTRTSVWMYLNKYYGKTVFVYFTESWK